LATIRVAGRDARLVVPIFTTKTKERDRSARLLHRVQCVAKDGVVASEFGEDVKVLL
jgi:hypothetical protein